MIFDIYYFDISIMKGKQKELNCKETSLKQKDSEN